MAVRQFVVLFVIALGQINTGFSQRSLDDIADSIAAEGKRLYASERTSWDGTDLFLEKFKDMDRLGGYFSYMDEDTPRCVFYSRDPAPVVIGSVSFDTSRTAARARVDLTPRPFSPREQAYYRLRSTAMTLVKSDTFFKKYTNTDLNLIPLIGDGERRVVVLTGPKQEGVMIFGNDYELRFDDQDQLVSKRRLHQSILVANFGKQDKDSIVGGIHTHNPETGPYITATDICTLMLYEKYAKWQTYTVMSADYVSCWDCSKDQMVILTMKAWKRITKDVEKRRGKS